MSDVHKATSLEEHIALVKKWAESIWYAWGSQHKVIFSYLND